MERITIKHLKALADRLNRMTGSPQEYHNADTGKANVGHFTISSAYGGFSLVRICNEDGAESQPMGYSGHVKARELYGKMQAFIHGIEFAATIS